MAVTENWHAHDYEPWASAWDYWNTHVLFSGIIQSHNSPEKLVTMLTGGDDLKMKGWDSRKGFDSPIFENRR